jgi:hypothetical protein
MKIPASTHNTRREQQSNVAVPVKQYKFRKLPHSR